MFTKLILKRGESAYGYDRAKISKETSFLGLISNILVALLKVVLYIFTGSISILSDAVNNITDCVSSIISIFGIRLAAKPRDKDHPYGHGRLEYLISLVVSGIVLSVGFQFLKTSVGKILHFLSKVHTCDFDFNFGNKILAGFTLFKGCKKD